MLEIRFHGRGGQGIVVGSSILGMAFFYDNKFVQFFPEFGVERRGAPLQAFLRVSESKIKTHFNIYKPDHIILFDSALLNSVNVTDGLKSNGYVLINSKKSPEDFRFCEGYKIATIDADGISLKNRLGTEVSPIINAAMAGAFARIIGPLDFDCVEKAIKESVPVKISENIASAKTAFENVKMCGTHFQGTLPGMSPFERSDFMNEKIVFNKESEMPLMAATLGSMEFNRTAAWRNIKPVIDYGKCSGCMICWKYCPDVSIEVKDEHPAINYDYCKGCGICSVQCPKSAIEMEAEEK